MKGPIYEPDWKVFRRLHPIALDRFCDRINSEVGNVLSAPSKTNHQKYLALYKLINRRNHEVAKLFDDFRRSTALMQIALIHSRKLFTGEEFEQFSQETRDFVEGYLELCNS